MIARNYRSSERKKQYRAVVIDAHTIFKFCAFFIAAIAFTAFIATGIKSAPLRQKAKPKRESGIKISEKLSSVLGGVCGFVIGFNPSDGKSAVAYEVPGAELVNSYGLVKSAEGGGVKTEPSPEPQPEPEEDLSAEGDLEIKAINAGQNASSNSNEVKIGNQTSYGVDVAELLAEPLSLNMTADGPKVLIVHTHATEAYSPEGARRYNSGDSERSTDTSKNVVAVGDEVARIFNERGIETLHDTALHDHPSFNGAYADALNSIEQYLSDYPSIQIVLDLHRDSIVYDDGTKAKLLTKIEDKNAAQLMFVVGTNEKGLYHPDWRENLKFAVKLQDAIDQKYPNLMRHIDLRKERFNCHATHGSLIIEMGSSGNSLSEAKYAMQCAAEVIADYLNGLM